MERALNFFCCLQEGLLGRSSHRDELKLDRARGASANEQILTTRVVESLQQRLQQRVVFGQFHLEHELEFEASGGPS